MIPISGRIKQIEKEVHTMPETMRETMKCPFRMGDDGEFCDCYGKACMAYYEVPYMGCAADDMPNSTPMCRKIFQPYPVQYPTFNPFQQFGR